MSTPLRVEDLYRLAVPAQPALSPDGSRVVYTLRTCDRQADANRHALWWAAPGTAPAPLTRGGDDTAAAWSPDGASVAFLRGEGGVRQLWLLPWQAGEPAPLTALPAGAGAPVWSPAGTRIAFTAPVESGAASPTQPVVADRLGYKADGVGLRRSRQHLFVVEVATGAVRQLTHGDWDAGAPVWSPAGTRIAFAAATAPEAGRTGESVVHLLDLSQPAPAPRPVGDRHGLLTPVAWTPDGAALLVVGRREVSIGHDRLLRVPVGEPDGDGIVELTAGLDRNVMPGGPGYPGGLPQVAADGETVLFCARDRGCTGLFAVDLAGGDRPRRLIGGDRVVSGLSVASAAGRAAVVVAAPDSYGEVVTLDLDGGEQQVLTAHSPTDLALFTPQEQSFTVADGTQVHGWLLRDPEAATPLPLLLDIHGGPHNAWSPVPDLGHAYHQMLAAQGWAVLLLNPRGSDGYGEQFFTAALGAWGLADEADLLEPVEQLVAAGIADPRRLAVAGYSYGGYLTCWLTGRTDRFAAAVAGGVVSDLTSMAGTSDSGALLSSLELGGQPFDDSPQWAAQSPYSRVDQVRTPTLILHGAADQTCPVGQAEQWFSALRARGVPTQMVLYPEASHLFILEGRPSHRIDYARRLVDWVARGPRPRRPVEADRWRQRLAEFAERYRVPGAVLGILHGDERCEVSYGVTNVETAVPVTPETVFQIGSITKVWTATVVMRLVDAGLLALDRPVVEYLPELKLADPQVTAELTLRHLLAHTSGVDGDVFTDTGRGDDCLARYVAGLGEVPQNHPLGVTWSYCNTGYAITGRLIEQVTGQVWDQAMREQLFAPLGLTRTVTLPEEALRYNSAVGHVHEGEEPYRLAPVWGLPRSAGPAGLVTASAGDVLTFARLHLSGGLAPNGTRLLSPESVAAMQACEAVLPDPYSLADSWGLGWFRMDWDGTRLIGHDGNTIGQAAFLRVLPEQELAVCLLTNGGHTRDLYQALVREVVRELAGLEMAAPLGPPADPVAVDIGPHVGVYERTGMRLEVLGGEAGPRLRMTVTADLPGVAPEARELALVPVRDDLFVTRMPGDATWLPVVFYRLADGTPYVHLGARATPKVSG